MGFCSHLGLALGWLALAPVGAHASKPETLLDSFSQEFMNAECAKTASCALKSFRVQVDRLSIPMEEGQSFGTRMTARYETREVSQLEQYGVAQFIQGCAYTSRKTASGIERSRDVEIPWRNGGSIPYLFPHFAIDGPLADPLDWSDVAHGSRHYHYQWNEAPNSTRTETAHYFGEKPPTSPALFVEDLPGTASFDPESGEARNLSLRFKTCLYRTADVPKSVAANQVDFARALHCFDWSSSWVYDHEQAKMSSPSDLVEFCR